MKIPVFLTSTVRCLAYVTAGMLDKITLQSNPEISILCYHAVGHDAWRFSIDIQVMVRQLTWLADKFQLLKTSDIAKYQSGELILTKPGIIITFDDGYEDILSLIPICDRLHIYPTVFLIGDPKQANRQQLETDRAFLTKKQIQLLLSHGWEIGSHSQTHVDFSKLNHKEQIHQILHSKQKLEKDLHIPIRWLAYPKGYHDRQIELCMKNAGYTYGLSLDDTILTHATNPYQIPRIGVDRTHSFIEFMFLTSPTVTKIRKILKARGVGSLM